MRSISSTSEQELITGPAPLFVNLQIGLSEKQSVLVSSGTVEDMMPALKKVL